MDFKKLNKTILHIKDIIEDSEKLYNAIGIIKTLIRKLDKNESTIIKNNKNEFTIIKNELIQIILKNKIYNYDKTILEFFNINSTILSSSFENNSDGPASKKKTSKSKKVTKKSVKLINNDKLKLKNINDNLKKFLGDFAFEIIDEKKKTFSADLAV